MSESCLFCRIVAGEIPATIVDRTDTTVAFRDIAPVSPTHVLVIPIVHVANLDEAVARDPQIAADVIVQCARIAEMEGLSDGYRVVINTGALAGQAVHHLHAHVLGGRAHSWPPG
jgi:histidine triad (HIT) family protein